MTGEDARNDPPDLARDFAALGQDWVTLWHSELAALAADRELAEMWRMLVALWAGAAGVALRAWPPAEPRSTEAHGGTGRNRRAAGAAGAAGADASAGTAPAAVAPGAGRDEIERLGRRVAELEQRLAELEHGRTDAGPRRRGSRGGRARRA